MTKEQIEKEKVIELIDKLMDELTKSVEGSGTFRADIEGYPLTRRNLAENLRRDSKPRRSE